MRQSLKIALSLLASLLLFAGFAVLAFSGLFNVLQASFFLPRIEKAYADDLQSLAAGLNRFHERNFTQFAAAAQKDYVGASFAPTLSDATLKEWAALGADLRIAGVRLLGSEGTRIFYSSFDIDIDSQNPTERKRSYKRYGDGEKSVPASEITVEVGSPPKLVLDGDHDRFIYGFPVSAAAGAEKQDGTLLFYVSANDLLGYLAGATHVSVDKAVVVGNAGLVINFDPAGSASVQEALRAIWSKTTGAAPASLP